MNSAKTMKITFTSTSNVNPIKGTRRGVGEIRERSTTKQVAARHHRRLAFKDLDQDTRLVVRVRREDLRLLEKMICQMSPVLTMLASSIILSPHSVKHLDRVCFHVVSEDDNAQEKRMSNRRKAHWEQLFVDFTLMTFSCWKSLIQFLTNENSLSVKVFLMLRVREDSFNWRDQRLEEKVNTLHFLSVSFPEMSTTLSNNNSEQQQKEKISGFKRKPTACVVCSDYKTLVSVETCWNTSNRLSKSKP